MEIFVFDLYKFFQFINLELLNKAKDVKTNKVKAWIYSKIYRYLTNPLKNLLFNIHINN